jgi:hypothetical protein
MVKYLSNEYKDWSSRLSDYDIGIRHECGPEQEVEREKGRMYYPFPLDKKQESY